MLEGLRRGLYSLCSYWAKSWDSTFDKFVEPRIQNSVFYYQGKLKGVMQLLAGPQTRCLLSQIHDHCYVTMAEFMQLEQIPCDLQISIQKITIAQDSSKFQYPKLSLCRSRRNGYYTWKQHSTWRSKILHALNTTRQREQECLESFL